MTRPPRARLRTVQALTLDKINDGVYRVIASAGGHVGNLKLIGGQWKFKAVGYGLTGELVPGGGHLTGRHNTVFDAPDEKMIAAILAPD